MSKYGNQKSGGFSSKLEHAVYQILKLRERAGEIKILRTQENIQLTKAGIIYIPDFTCEYLPTGGPLFVEAKGFEGPRWPTIKKLWKHYGLGPLEIWKGSHLRPVLAQTIIPEGTE